MIRSKSSRKLYDPRERRRVVLSGAASSGDSDSSTLPQFIRRKANTPTPPKLRLIHPDERFRQPKPKRKWPQILLLLLLLVAVAYWYLTQKEARPPEFVGFAPSPPLASSLPELAELFPTDTAVVSIAPNRSASLRDVGKQLGLLETDTTKLDNALKKLPTAETEKVFTAGRSLTFLFSPDGSLTQFTALPETTRELIATRAASGEFAVMIQPVLTGSREHVVVGLVESSFAAAAKRAGVEYNLIDDLVDMFSDRIEFNKDFKKGDRFTIIYRDERLGDGRKTGKGQILAAAIEIKDQNLIATRYVGGDGKARYFDETGKPLGSFFLRYPVKFSRISSVFSDGRLHPVLRIKRPHNGVDFAAPTGTPVRTVADGVVLFAGRKGGNGIMLKIRHSVRYSTAYVHLSSIAKGLKNGSRVRKGDVIGAVGMTGLATGPHLHFSFYDNGKYVDPLKIKLPTLDALDSGTKINDSYLRRVIFTLNHYQTVDLKPFYTEPVSN